MWWCLVFQWETVEMATKRRRHTTPSTWEQQHPTSPKLWVSLKKCNKIYASQFFLTPPLLLSAPGAAEARRSPHSPCGSGGRKPDAGAVRQAGGRQHQDEALDGGDLCAFNRQRKAMVQVEVTSFSLLSLPLSFSQWKRWNVVSQSRPGIQKKPRIFLLHTITTGCTFPPSFFFLTPCALFPPGFVSWWYFLDHLFYLTHNRFVIHYSINVDLSWIIMINMIKIKNDSSEATVQHPVINKFKIWSIDRTGKTTSSIKCKYQQEHSIS